ncbi:extracellular solute-binding protein [Bradyrhizobium sp. LHD-71]|uniref:ABC transporter substrate-binding protein n=1 Tax=Bradyrhizobium sp. LHD-71 TaxID=3072141 RepID=UPI00280D32CA|nr:extracellular solute-binding protein [Bradyrhizobium sp. LHD-71]MDQ8729755.1 extracellular solute-binding protein [Bradyrhizobium sp. LHD-71]
MNMNRRELLGGLGAVAAIPLVGSAASAEDPAEKAYFAELYNKAKGEGELTWYIGHWRTETAERIGGMFSELYPGVRCNVVRATGQVLYQRLTQDMRAKVANCDVFSSTDLGQYVSLREQKLLLPFKPRRLVECEPLARDFDPTHQITITDANTTVMCYNTNLVKAEDAPKRWTDLLDPKWMNQVAVAHPGFSGAMGGWVLTMTNLYGWEYFEKLKANKPFVGRSLVDPPTSIGSGERKVGIGPGNLTLNLAAKGTPLQTVYPDDGTIIGFSPTSILTSSVRPNAAKLFVEFLLSREAQTAATKEFTTPTRLDVQPQPGVSRISERKGLTRDADQLHRELPELIEKWRDTFGV